MTTPTTPPTVPDVATAPDPTLPAATFDPLAHAFAQSLSPFKAGQDSLAANVYANAGVAYDAAVAASASAATASAAANYKGAWSTLTGSLAIPASVSHDNRLWSLVASVADVTAHTPGVSGQWLSLGGTTTIADDVTVVDASVSLTAVLGSSCSGMSLVELDSTRDLLTFYGANGCHAVVYNKPTNSFGVAVLIRSATYPLPKAVLVSADKVLVATLPSSTTALQTVVLTISGTTITVGTPVSTTLASNCINYESDKLFAVGSSFIFEYATAAGTPALRAITVSGSTPTVGNELTLTGFYGGPSWALTSTTFLAVRASNTTLYATPITVSGTTLTTGTQATATVTAYAGLTGVALTSGRFAVTYTNSTVYGGIISVSGTTATISTVNTTLSAGTATDRALLAVGAQAIVGTTDSATVLTDNSGTAVVGTTISSLGNAFGYSSTAMLFNHGSVAGGYVVIGISGNNPVTTFHWPFRFDTTTTTQRWASWRQNNAKLSNEVLRSSTGKHLSVGTDGVVPFGLSCISGAATKRYNQHPMGVFFKGVSDALGYGFSAGTGSNIWIRRLEIV